MLRRVTTTYDGTAVDRFQTSTRIYKPFKPPTIAKTPADRSPPRTRKRKRVDYKDTNNSDVENEGRMAKKKKSGHDDDYDEGDGEHRSLNLSKSFPVYEPKPSHVVMNSKFTIPEIRSKTGEIVAVIRTNISLGIRPLSAIPPRPLHDPMQDHAIVLYDPTIDDRETDEERLERLKEGEKLKAEEEARKKTEGMFNPHKSLRLLLGENTNKMKNQVKVPVVIDPRLSKVLRPHQIEGVKVCSMHFYFKRRKKTTAQNFCVSSLFSFFIDVLAG